MPTFCQATCGAGRGGVGLVEQVPGVGVPAPSAALSILAQRSCMFTGEPDDVVGGDRAAADRIRSRNAVVSLPTHLIRCRRCRRRRAARSRWRGEAERRRMPTRVELRDRAGSVAVPVCSVIAAGR